MVPAPRDAFLQRLLETLGRSAAAVDTTQAPGAIDNLMQDNPLAFTPTLPFQAVMHAKASLAMGLPASPHLEPVEAYLSGQQELDWQALGLQGLADFAVRLDDATAADLERRLAKLPDEVLISLCYCLEHVPLASDSLAHALRAREKRPLRQGMSNSSAPAYVPCAVHRRNSLALGSMNCSRTGGLWPRSAGRHGGPRLAASRRCPAPAALPDPAG